MPGVNERPYLSIGEVLGLLLEEFPDVTISKIRFLESQGLIEPERTSSGYRKFYDGDVERLKVILREQRENFLPLRVIRDRLEARAIDDSGGTARTTTAVDPTVAASADATDSTSARPSSSDPAPSNPTPSNPSQSNPTRGDPAPAPLPAQAATPRGIRNLRLAATTGDDAATGGDPVTSDRHPASQGKPVPRAERPPAAGPPRAPTPAASRSASVRGEVYSRDELCSLTGVRPADLDQLESFGIVAGRGSGPSATYTDGDVAIVRAAAGFLARGIDARHLRSWRQAAEREAGLFEQRILPLLRQRNPQARHDATQLLEELAELGGQLRAAIVHATLRHHLDP